MDKRKSCLFFEQTGTGNFKLDQLIKTEKIVEKELCISVLREIFLVCLSPLCHLTFVPES